MNWEIITFHFEPKKLISKTFHIIVTEIWRIAEHKYACLKLRKSLLTIDQHPIPNPLVLQVLF